MGVFDLAVLYTFQWSMDIWKGLVRTFEACVLALYKWEKLEREWTEMVGGDENLFGWHGWFVL